MSISNIFIGQDRGTIPLRFERQELPINFVQDATEAWDGIRVERALIDTLPSECLDLEVRLSSSVQDGANGLIYKLKVPRTTTVRANDGQQLTIPPLIGKFAPRARNKPIAREAWFYDEMQSLQGLIIPYCFGYFVATVPEGKEIRPWVNDSMQGQRSRKHDGDPQMEMSYYNQGVGSFVESGENREILTRLENSRCISLLLLERLGLPYLPAEDNITREIRFVHQTLGLGSDLGC